MKSMLEMRSVASLLGIQSLPQVGSLQEAALATYTYLQATGELKLRFVERRMAELLGLDFRKDQAWGSTLLGDVDRGPWGEGFLTVLAAEAIETRGYVQREVTLSSPAGPETPGPAGGRGLRRRGLPRLPPHYRLGAIPVRTRDGGVEVQVIAADETELHAVRTLFSRYVPPDALAEIEALPPEDILARRRREVAILFADLRGYSLFASSASPELVGQAVDEFLGCANAAINAQRGMVVSYGGDCVMAMFGAPVSVRDYGLLAIQAGLGICRGFADLRQRWLADRTLGEDPTRVPGVGVGVHAGSAVVGNVGVADRLEYTAIGHTVNLASRLCGEAAAGEVVCSTALWDLAKAQAASRQQPLPPEPRQVRPKTLKNIPDPVPVVVFGPDSP